MFSVGFLFSFILSSETCYYCCWYNLSNFDKFRRILLNMLTYHNFYDVVNSWGFLIEKLLNQRKTLRTKLFKTIASCIVCLIFLVKRCEPSWNSFFCLNICTEFYYLLALLERYFYFNAFWNLSFCTYSTKLFTYFKMVKS